MKIASGIGRTKRQYRKMEELLERKEHRLKYNIFCYFFYSLMFSGRICLKKTKEIFNKNYLYQDTLKKKPIVSKNISGIFAGVGGGLSIPMAGFKDNSDVTFGILGRLDFSSTYIFPFVIGAEITYFSYDGADQFKTVNLLSNLTTDIIGVGLNLEYLLTKILPSAFTMPFVSVDVKYNSLSASMILIQH
jgi:hypothetical protein